MADGPVARLDGAAIQIKNLLFVFAGYSTIDYKKRKITNCFMTGDNNELGLNSTAGDRSDPTAYSELWYIVDIYNFSDNTWGGRFDMPKEMAHSNLGMVTDGRYITLSQDSMGHSAEGPLPIHSCLILRQSSGGTCPLYQFLDHWSLAVKDGKALEKEWRTEIPIARGGPHRTTSGPVSSGGMPGPASLKKSNSGPLNKHGEPLKKSSGPQSGGVTPTGRQNSGPLPPVLPATGLITSGPISSGPLNASGAPLKVSGVVTCGNLPLELSFQKVPRCMYTSTSLYEYRGWDSKAANPTHHRFTWGLRSIEWRVVDFYISDFQSGLRALVKTGSGARVTPYVDDSIVIDVNPENEELSPEFIGREEPFK
ncbi:hypothetical protein L3X38_006345 [Prunus dulcis]|uniref:Uncharacterized protein n=1 Tax=Prunus dulcis TaxID=3755 RepID=A0AAD4ZST6_PRUDU|nr:hypothetical protein L3X38_006345 [Prunus dulcis]